MRCCVLLISVCVASAASFKEGDFPTCHVDSAGRTIVKYTDTLQSHQAFKCTHAGNKCTCGAHPTHRDCRQFDHTDASTHTLGGGCQQPIEGCAGKTLSLFNSANTRICACVDASAVNGKCSQYTPGTSEANCGAGWHSCTPSDLRDRQEGCMKIDMNDANQPAWIKHTSAQTGYTFDFSDTKCQKKAPCCAAALSGTQQCTASGRHPEGWRLYFQPKHMGSHSTGEGCAPHTHHRCGFGSKHTRPIASMCCKDKPKPKYVKVWKATGKPGSCGWSTSPTYCTLGEPDRIHSCWRYGSVGYCEVGKNCGGFFTDAQMQKKSGQRMGSCTIDVVTTARCTSNNCKAPTPTAKITDLCSAPGPAGNQTPKTSCSAMSSPDSTSCSGEAFILSRPDKYCKGTKTCGVKTEAECRKLCGDAGAQCAGFSNYCSIGHPNCVKGLNGCRCHRGPRKSGCRGCTARITFASSCT